MTPKQGPLVQTSEGSFVEVLIFPSNQYLIFMLEENKSGHKIPLGWKDGDHNLEIRQLCRDASRVQARVHNAWRMELIPSIVRWKV